MAGSGAERTGRTGRLWRATSRSPTPPDELRIGRRADLEVTAGRSPALSSVHARLLRTGGAWLVEDAGSTNGTWLDGARLLRADGARQALTAGRGS